MAELRVRDLEENVVAVLKWQAKQKGRTLQAELKGLLTEEAYRPKRELAAMLQELRDRIRTQSGVLPDSADMIREERERRW